MKKRKHPFDIVVDKYVKQRTTEEENLLLDHLMRSLHDEDDWDESVLGNKNKIEKNMLRNIHTQIDRGKQTAFFPKKLRTAMVIAASVVVLLSLPVLWHNHFFSASSMVTVQSHGSIDSLRLPDGSTIYLSPHTKLTYQRDFNHASRHVWLTQGNAFFKVARQPDKPFVVTSGEVQTKVLGTSFNINTMKGNCTITVYTGKVNVWSPYGTMDLQTHEEATLVRSERQLQKTVLGNEALQNWFTDNLTLKDLTVRHIVETIEKKFGKKIAVDDTVGIDKKATVFIPQDATLQNVLEQLNYITNLKLSVAYEINTDQ
ncbi:MAG: FecR family protein [Breznakibacter sp.]